MANLSFVETAILGNLFQTSGGRVLNFTNRTFADFFRKHIGRVIDHPMFNDVNNSKANRLKSFWRKMDDRTVGISILKLIEYIESQILMGKLNKQDFPDERMMAGKGIGEKLLRQSETTSNTSNGSINITLQKEIFAHVHKLLTSGHYYNAVEEAYKVVRRKLKSVSGKERATDAFAAANLEKIFGRLPVDKAESNFFEGVKFLHIAIQFLRNEKAHTPAHALDKNLAIHYIALASLAYDLITRQ